MRKVQISRRTLAAHIQIKEILNFKFHNTQKLPVACLENPSVKNLNADNGRLKGPTGMGEEGL